MLIIKNSEIIFSWPCFLILYLCIALTYLLMYLFICCQIVFNVVYKLTDLNSQLFGVKK